MEEIVKRIKAERKEEFERGKKEALEWAKDQKYERLERATGEDSESLPVDYFSKSEEYRRGFKKALEEIFALSEEKPV